MHETTKMGFSEQKHWVGPLFLKLPLDDIELESMRAVDLKIFLGYVVSQELSYWVRDFNLCGERGVE